MAATTRPYQVVVWGASGFTGRLVCEHLVRDYGGRVRWAMAGRDAKRMEAFRDDLARINPNVKDVPILVADAMDKAALGSVLKQTQVVLALAGPFAKYGDLVVNQAVEQGTHYCDITGEMPWVKRSVLANDSAAKAKGVKIVHCCGYDSVPADLGALMMAQYCKETLGKQLDQVYTIVGKGRGGVSGGTIASGFNMAETEPISEMRKLGTDAYYLSTARQGSDKPAPSGPRYIKEADTWAGPWVMEAINAKIVQYSNAIAPKGPYGPDFKYCEMMEGGKGWSGWAAANIMALGNSLLGIGFALAPARFLMKKVLPAPGQGPSQELQRTGYWTHKVIGVTHEPNGQQPTVFTGEVGDKRDAGYWSTSRMILETGLALILDADKIAKTGECLPAGVLTPATAAGRILLDRLRAAGFTFRVDGPVGVNGAMKAPQVPIAAEKMAA